MKHEKVAAVPSAPDRRLLNRFRDSEHSSITAMMDGHSPIVPKHSGKEVCLSWALKGECSASCKRGKQHVRYSRDTNSQIHKLLDECGVANPQA